MMLDTKTLGLRIRNFRKRAGMSQFELENAINASPGSLSRIENGDVNPTKETVYGIADILKLQYREVDYLIGITSKPATTEEINIALEEVDEYFKKPDVLAYLIDERWRIFKVSDKFLRFIKKDQDYIQENFGKTTFEFMSDPSLGVFEQFAKGKLYETFQTNMQYYYKEVGFMQDDEIFQKTIETLRKNPFTSKIWDEIIKKNDYNYSIREGRKVNFQVLNKFEIPIVYNYEPLLNSTRFQIVVLRAEGKFIDMLAKLLI